jgi:gas vesicle protein
VDPYIGAGRSATPSEGIGQLSSSGRGGHGFGGGSQEEDRDSQLLPQATWIPQHPPTPDPPTDDGDEEFQDKLGVTGKVGSAIRGFSSAEIKDGLVSSGVGAVFAPVRQAALIGSSIIGNTARRGLNGLADGIHYGVDVIGSGFDRLSTNINNGVHRTMQRFDGFVNRSFVDPVNKWAVGELGEEFAASGGVRGAATNLWRGAVSRVKGFGQSLTQPNSPNFNAKLSAVGGFGAVISTVGRLQNMRTGQQGWADAAGVGDLISGGANLVGLRGKLVTAFSSTPAQNALQTASRWAPLAQNVVKATGVLSVVTGGISAYTQTRIAISDYRKHGQLTKKGQIAAARAGAGVLAAMGGALLLTPVAPVGGVLLATSGIISAGTWVAENWDRFKPGLDAWKGVAENAKTIVRTAATQTYNNVRDRVTRTASDIQRGVRDIASRVTSTVSRTVQNVSSRLSTTVNSAVDKTKNFFGDLFGNKASQVPEPLPKPTPKPTSTPSPRQISQNNSSRSTTRRSTSSRNSKSRHTRSRKRVINRERRSYWRLKGR